MFQPGVRYNLSLYSCSSDTRELLKCWQGYSQELGRDTAAHWKLIFKKTNKQINKNSGAVHFNPWQFFSFSPCSSNPFPPFVVSTVPSVALTLSASQQNADILLTWKEIPLVNRRGYLLGYNIYNSTGYQFKLLGIFMILLLFNQ